MKKIMFKDRFGLTKAVLELYKTMTRRIIGQHVEVDWNRRGKVYLPISGFRNGVLYMDCREFLPDSGKFDYPAPRQYQPRYAIGEEVAIAQKYWDLHRDNNFYKALAKADPTFPLECIRGEKGCNNKMFVKAAWMPHRIRIKSIKAERLQDISDEDCQKEGIIPITWRQWHKQDLNDFSPQRYTDHDVWTLPKFREGIENPWADSDPDEYMAETAKAAFAVLINRISGKGTWERNPWVFAYEFELIK